MLPFDKKLEDLVEQDLQRVIDAGVSESRIIEYKAQLPGSTNEEKKEFLRDVTSFANSAGGHIIYGIEADKNAIPVRFKGIPNEGVDKQTLRLEQIIRTGVDPIIHGLKIRAVPLSAELGTVLLIEIPRGLFGPHMIKGRGAFVGRTSAGKMEMDFGEIRSAFVGSELSITHLREFLADRLASLRAGQYPVALVRSGFLAIHLLPLESFTPGYKCDLTKVANDNQGAMLIPYRRNWAWGPRFTFDGFLQVAFGGTKEPLAFCYSQLFRNGAIEIVNCDAVQGYEHGKIRAIDVELATLRAIKASLPIFEKLEIRAPYYAIISLLNVNQLKLVWIRYGHYDSQERVINRDHLLLPEAVIDNASSPLDELLRPTFDVLWNSCGWWRSMHYDETGRYEPDWQREN